MIGQAQDDFATLPRRCCRLAPAPHDCRTGRHPMIQVKLNFWGLFGEWSQ